MSALYNADARDILKQIDTESIDCVITDCPYKVISGGCTNTTFKMMNSNSEMIKSGKLFDHNDIEFREWIPDVYRVLKQNTHCYIMVNSRNVKDLQIEAEKAGFEFQNMLIWEKGNTTPNKWYMQGFEIILMLRKGKARPINEPGTSNIIRIQNNVGNKLHPTEKPPKLMEILIRNSTNENEIVLDPFMGVGGTVIAAKQLNRQYIGIEIDKKYYDIALDRLKNINESSLLKQMSFDDL